MQKIIEANQPKIVYNDRKGKERREDRNGGQ